MVEGVADQSLIMRLAWILKLQHADWSSTVRAL